MPYTHSISYYKKVDGLGWMFEDCRTTADNVRQQLRSLLTLKKEGTVRVITLQRLKDYEAKVD